MQCDVTGQSLMQPGETCRVIFWVKKPAMGKVELHNVGDKTGAMFRYCYCRRTTALQKVSVPRATNIAFPSRPLLASLSQAVCDPPAGTTVHSEIPPHHIRAATTNNFLVLMFQVSSPFNGGRIQCGIQVQLRNSSALGYQAGRSRDMAFELISLEN